LVEGDRRVSFSKIMSVFSKRARERSSFSLCLIPLEFQNSIFKLLILGREYGQECFDCCFYKGFWILIVG